MADKKFLDEDGVSQFAEETKKYVDKHADNADIHVTADDKANWDGKQDALTAEQLAAVNSGINATDKGNYDAHIANADIHVTSDDKANWNGKANDADVVHKSGNETIAGVKTFTSSTVIDGSGKLYQAYASDYIKGGVPSDAMYQGVRFYDDQKISTVANHITGAFELQYGTDGYNKAYVGCRNYSGTSQLNYNVGLRVPNDATKSIDFFPSVDNKINLGTSNYRWADTNTVLLNGKTPAYASDLNDVVHKSGNETVNGTKTFTSNIRVTKTAPDLALNISDCDVTEIPTEAKSGTLYFRDKNNKNLSYIVSQQRIDGTKRMCLRTHRTDNINNYYSVNLDSDGDFYPEQNNAINLGSSALKWKNVNTFLLNGKTPETIEEQGDGYIRYSSGLQICWGIRAITWETSEKVVDTSFAKNFKDTNISISLTHIRRGYVLNTSSQIYFISPSYFSAQYTTSDASGNTDGHLVYQAIGYWK